MHANDDLTPELRLQGARDWAHSVQARYAEKIAGRIAQIGPLGASAISTAHLNTMREAVADAGVDHAMFDEALARIGGEKLSEFDEPIARLQIEGVVEQILATMGAVNLSAGGRELIISSIPSGMVNAFCGAASWDDHYHHIFVDSDLLIFCSSLAKIVANCCTRRLIKDGQLQLCSSRIPMNAKSQDVRIRIMELFGSIVFEGSVRASKPWIPDPKALPLQVILAEAMERFVIAHEISHLMLGHLENASEVTKSEDPSFPDVEAMIFSREAEHQADIAGAVIATETAVRNGSTHALTSIAPYIFLAGVEVLDNCLSTVERPVGGIDSTHPPARARREVLRAAMAAHIGQKDPNGDLPLILKRIDQLFYWIGHAAGEGIRMRQSKGHVPAKRVSLKVFQEGSPPQILGYRADPVRLSEFAQSCEKTLLPQAK
jgi:hypothetical protein